MGKERFEEVENVGLVADHRAEVPENTEEEFGRVHGGKWGLDWARE